MYACMSIQKKGRGNGKGREKKEEWKIGRKEGKRKKTKEERKERDTERAYRHMKQTNNRNSKKHRQDCDPTKMSSCNKPQIKKKS